MRNRRQHLVLMTGFPSARNQPSLQHQELLEGRSADEWTREQSRETSLGLLASPFSASAGPRVRGGCLKVPDRGQHTFMSRQSMHLF